MAEAAGKCLKTGYKPTASMLAVPREGTANGHLGMYFVGCTAFLRHSVHLVLVKIPEGVGGWGEPSRPVQTNGGARRTDALWKTPHPSRPYRGCRAPGKWVDMRLCRDQSLCPAVELRFLPFSLLFLPSVHPSFISLSFCEIRSYCVV